MKKIWLSLSLFLLVLSSCSGGTPSKSHPHIILCMADDQGWGDMGYYNHPYVKTPNFDDMAKNSLRLDRFYASAPVCSPTRASVLTGRNPNRGNVPDHGRSLRPQEVTIAEALKKAGYVTGHFGKWHIGSVQKPSPVNPGKAGFDDWLSAPNFFDLDPYMSRNGVAVRMKGESSMIIVDAAIDFLRKNKTSNKPMFCVVWFSSPHDPFQALEEDKKLYQGKKRAPYYREMTAMDRAFGKLRKELKDLGIKKDTLLWYCSDNGGLNPETTGGRAKKGVVYEGGLRVPGLIEWPARIPQARVSNLPTYTSDIYPTLLELTGVKIKNQPVIDGESLVSLIDNKSEERAKPLMFWSRRPQGRSTYSNKLVQKLMEAQKNGSDIGDEARLDMDAAEIKVKYALDDFWGHAAINQWPWKLHRIQKKGQKEFVYELYNLETDPRESKNVVEEQKDLFKKLSKELKEWQVSVLKSMNGEDYK